jgi:signal transduction histidine kinase
VKARVSGLPGRLAEAKAAPKAAAGRQKEGPPALPDGHLEKLGVIAHDLNNVFTAILMAVQLLRQKVSGEKEARLLTVLEENAARGAELVKQVRVLGPDDSGGRSPAQPSQVPGESGAEPRRPKAPRERSGK